MADDLTDLGVGHPRRAGRLERGTVDVPAAASA